MASGYTMNPTVPSAKGDVKMAPTKKSKELPAGKFKVEAGGSGKMQSFKGVGDQQPGVSSVSAKSAGKKFSGPSAGGSGKMHGFSGVKKQKSGRSGQS
jgi:hypothetical protein